MGRAALGYAISRGAHHGQGCRLNGAERIGAQTTSRGHSGEIVHTGIAAPKGHVALAGDGDAGNPEASRTGGRRVKERA